MVAVTESHFHIKYTVLKSTACTVNKIFWQCHSYSYFIYFFLICIKHINSETKKLLHDSSQGIEKNMLKTSDGLHWIKMLAGTEILEATLSRLTLVCALRLRTELSNIDCLQPHTEGRDTKGNRFHDWMCGHKEPSDYLPILLRGPVSLAL